MTALHSTQFVSPGGGSGAFQRFVVADPSVTQSLYVTSNSTNLYVTSWAVEAMPVACALR